MKKKSIFKLKDDRNEYILKQQKIMEEIHSFYGSDASFRSLFNTIDKFTESSGCKLNISKSEAIWIGSSQGSQSHPFSDTGLKWNKTTFKTLGIHFSLNVNQLYDLNHKIKLISIENTLNCWRARNLSLVGKICVIKTLLLPQLLYFFFLFCFVTLLQT